ncbi:MAG: hypothetical protein WCX73_05525, partial [Candidatus Pacearchaeota archaeon]
CGSNGKLIDEQTIVKPYVEAAIISDYVAPHGSIVKGQVRQESVTVNLNDRLSAFVWENYSFKEKAINERDFGLNYKIPLNKNFSAYVGAQHWTYPSGTFGDFDDVLKAGINYSGPIDLNLDVTHLLENKNTESGTRYYLKASKSFQIYENKKQDLKISFTPNVSTAWINNYYGKSGNSQATIGFNLGLTKGNFNLNFFVNKQEGQIDGIEDFTWSGISAGWQF